MQVLPCDDAGGRVMVIGGGVHGFYLVVFGLDKIVSLRVESLGRIRGKKFGSGFCHGFNGCNINSGWIGMI